MALRELGGGGPGAAADCRYRSTALIGLKIESRDAIKTGRLSGLLHEVEVHDHVLAVLDRVDQRFRH